MQDVVQYLIVRGDLIKTLKWPVGALIAQACHASTAAMHLFYSDAHTVEYLENLDNMHKVVLEVVIFIIKKLFNLICLNGLFC